MDLYNSQLVQPDLGLSSALGIFSPEVNEEELKKVEEIKRKKKERVR